jgi:hypothetical protein
MAVVTAAFLGVASAAAFDVQVRGHLTRSQTFCPDGAVLCGTAYIEGYGNAEYRSFLVANGGPSESCGPHSGLVDYDAIVTFTLPDGSTLKLHEVGTLCTPGNSFPTGGLNSYGNPLSFDAHWQVVLATGQFAGLIGSGTSRGTFAGAAIVIRYGGTVNEGSNDATVRLSWDIVVNGAPGTCDEVGASHIRVLLSGVDTTEVEFDCDQKSAEFVINAGNYAAEIELVDTAGVILGVAVRTFEVFIGYVFDLGHYEFAFQL